MATVCHLCESGIVTDSAATNGTQEGFECNDCGKPTCPDCKSIGVARSTEHCQRCRG